MNKTPLEELQYKYNTLKIVCTALACWLAFTLFISVTLVDQKQYWRALQHKTHTELVETIAKPICPTSPR